MKRLLIIPLICLLAAPVYAAVSDEPYIQEIAHRRADSLELGHVTALAPGLDGAAWALTAEGLYRLQDGASVRADERIGVTITPGMTLASAARRGGALLLAAPNRIALYSPRAHALAQDADFDSVNAAALSFAGDAWIATDSGLFRRSRGNREFERIAQIDEPVHLVACSDTGLVAAATELRVWRFDGERWRFEWVDAMFGPVPTALAFDGDDNLWLGNEECLYRIRTDWAIERVDGYAGLPYNRITCLADGGEHGLWIGTEKGAIRYNDGVWRYYHGPRWLAGERVHSIAALDDGAWIATDGGLTFIALEEWTLARKAEHYQAMVYPRHDRHGLVAGVHLTEFGDIDSYAQRDDDNDGLWTGIYLGALCYQYAVTGDPEVKRNAWRHFEAMERLETITPIEGFIARSYVTADNYHGQSGEWHPTEDGEWYWKGDTSSDELVGHMFVYPLVYDLVAETEAEKRQVRDLIDRIMTHVVDSGYYLIDVDGEPTRWGVWAPEQLNDDPVWSYERGLNSLQILAFLSAAHKITGNDKYRDAFFELVRKHDYAVNTVNQKMKLPYEENHSDDELAFLPYYTLFRYNDDANLRPIFETGLERSWLWEEKEKSSLWNYIHSAAMKTESGLEDAVWTLRHWPFELIDWPVEAAHRLDLTPHRYPDRFGRVQYLELLPPDERRVMRWNANPFWIEGGNGHGAHDPGAWLLPYWMGRYYGFIE